MIEYWICRADRPIHTSDLIALTHLYQPLVGTSAIALYITLSNQTLFQSSRIRKLQSKQLLMGLLSFTEEELIRARHLLEGVGLLNAYQVTDDKEQTYPEYEIIPPLSPKKFFQSDILCMALYHQIGKERFLAIKEEMLPYSNQPFKKRVDITKSYQEVFDRFSPQEMAQYAKFEQENLWTAPEAEEIQEGTFPKHKEQDLTSLRSHLGSQIEDKEWTEELVKELIEIKYLYQLDDWGLLKALQNPEVTRQGAIDIRALKRFVREEFQHRFDLRDTTNPPLIDDQRVEMQPVNSDLRSKEEIHLQQLSQISPIELLSFYQDGAKIPDSDLELVESLVHEYGLPYGVINVLLEYVLLKYDFKLPKALVQKIAGHWKRLRITTVQEAFAQAKKENWEVRKKTQNTKRSNRVQSERSTNRKSQPIPQAVAEQMKGEEFVHKQENDQDRIEKRARINQKLALWESRKKRV